ncbi:cache domain-containing protein [Paraburkholderia dipogonis]|uniref:Cache domain-containing protein n=1 Tax=Paraburkholderia dipogonis TaxID=1211383 RepID=A0ABW9B7U0_9BURK
MWPRPGEERPALKLTRVATFRPWGWIFRNGAYTDDIGRAFTIHCCVRAAPWSSARRRSWL